jgi:hypothetical protein
VEDFPGAPESIQPGLPACAELYHPLRVSDVFRVKEVLVALLDGWTPFRFKKHFSFRSLLLEIIGMDVFFWLAFNWGA